MKGQNALAAETKRQNDIAQANYQQSLKLAQTPSPEEAAKTKDWLAEEDYFAKKDYSKPPPGMVSMNYADPAARQRQRELIGGAQATGAAGLGSEGANPTALQMGEQEMANEFDLDSASNYERQLNAENEYHRTGDALSLMNIDFSRKSSLLGNTSGQATSTMDARIRTQPTLWLPGLLAAGIGAAGAFAGGPAFGAGGVFNH